MLFKIGESICQYAFDVEFCKYPAASLGVMSICIVTLLTGIALSRFFIFKTSDTNIPRTVTMNKTDSKIKVMNEEEFKRFIKKELRFD